MHQPNTDKRKFFQVTTKTNGQFKPTSRQRNHSWPQIKFRSLRASSIYNKRIANDEHMISQLCAQEANIFHGWFEEPFQIHQLNNSERRNQLAKEASIRKVRFY